MRYSEYIGDYNLDLEGEPDEIIKILKYIDKETEEEGIVRTTTYADVETKAKRELTIDELMEMARVDE